VVTWTVGIAGATGIGACIDDASRATDGAGVGGKTGGATYVANSRSTCGFASPGNVGVARIAAGEATTAARSMIGGTYIEKPPSPTRTAGALGGSGGIGEIAGAIELKTGESDSKAIGATENDFTIPLTSTAIPGIFSISIGFNCTVVGVVNVGTGLLASGETSDSALFGKASGSLAFAADGNRSTANGGSPDDAVPLSTLVMPIAPEMPVAPRSSVAKKVRLQLTESLLPPDASPNKTTNQTCSRPESKTKRHIDGRSNSAGRYAYFAWWARNIVIGSSANTGLQRQRLKPRCYGKTLVLKCPNFTSTPNGDSAKPDLVDSSGLRPSRVRSVTI
jgi:hypothetical protein